MKAVFYGDSNTYGYDPRGFFGGRYDEELIWTTLAEKALHGSWRIINEGMNGRQLPVGEYAYAYIERMLSVLSTGDIFAVMLGTNDLLVSLEPDAGVPVRRMEELLRRLTAKEGGPGLLIIAPPYIGTADHPDPLMARYYAESVRMNEGYRRLSDEYGTLFADSAKWGVELAFDDVHFSENGHRTFAGHISEVLTRTEKRE